MSKLTPLMQQYYEIKKHYSNAILLYRMGDFYETFDDDARKISKILDIALTSRDKNVDHTPLAGFPYHAIDTFVPKLLEAGLTVAIAEQVENPKFAKGLVKRKVTSVITPGTVYQSNLLNASKNNFIVALAGQKGTYAMAVTDLSTGEVKVSTTMKEADLLTELQRIDPSEVLTPRKFNVILPESFIIQTLDVKPDDLTKEICNIYKVHNLGGLGLEDLVEGSQALGLLLRYFRDNYIESLEHLKHPTLFSVYDTMILDNSTVKSLDIPKLFELLNQTKTPMGARNLRYQLTHPLLKKSPIDDRLDKVTFFIEHKDITSNVQALLAQISDIERIAGKIGLRRVRPLDVASLAKSLKLSIEILSVCNSKIWPFDSHRTEETIQKITEALVENPPINDTEGGYIKVEYDSEVAKFRNIQQNSGKLLKEYEHSEAQKHGITSLKIRFNNIWGYYIEITQTHKDKVPVNYIHKQTLANSARYTTPELQKLEQEILSAKDACITREREVFEALITQLIQDISNIQALADIVSQIDIASSLAYIAAKQNYCRPTIHPIKNHRSINIKAGRHPIVEHGLGNSFVPNDTQLSDKAFVHVITGPNMSGKSTYLRQVALTVLMAQVGMYVPAKNVELEIVDRIFTRIGAGDDIASGRSTFMVEMSEMSNILSNATSNSLLILDEIGRGTSTYDGMAIAWAITEYIAQNLGARTLFATHYHELTQLAGQAKGVKNYTVSVLDSGDKQVTFLYQIEAGVANKSYGVHVAQIAGISASIIKKSEEILSRFEQKQLPMTDPQMPVPALNQTITPKPLFTPQPKPSSVEQQILDLNLDETTPMQAMAKLHEIQEKLK